MAPRPETLTQWQDINDHVTKEVAKEKGCRIAIDGKWYDLSKWAPLHPGGEFILTMFNNKDATDAFHSLHSTEAHNRLKHMHATPVLSTDPVAAQRPSKVALAFRDFRAKLIEEGWFTRDWIVDAKMNALIYFMLVTGTALAYSHPIIASLLIGVAMQQTGWLGHDYVHGRGDGCWTMGRLLGGVVNGFSSEWWSNKHNTHHVFPNYMGIDTDIYNEPVFYLWLPDKKGDHPMRHYQHWYYFPVVAALYISWRIQSFKYAWARKNVTELSLMAIHYWWVLVVLPWSVSLAATLIGGFLVGIIVTVTHQSETMMSPLSEHNYCYYTDQFMSTRDVKTSDFVMEYLWGGMQYQLEHHLFPTMPRYKYPALRPRLQAFAKSVGIEYRMSGVWEIWCMTYETLKRNAAPLAADK